MNKIISCERDGSGWRIEVRKPGGAPMVLTLYGSKAQALEWARWNMDEPEPA